VRVCPVAAHSVRWVDGSAAEVAGPGYGRADNAVLADAHKMIHGPSAVTTAMLARLPAAETRLPVPIREMAAFVAGAAKVHRVHRPGRRIRNMAASVPESMKTGGGFDCDIGGGGDVVIRQNANWAVPPSGLGPASG